MVSRRAAALFGAVFLLLIASSAEAASSRAVDTETAQCRDLRDAIEREQKTHDWNHLLADGRLFQQSCAVGNDILLSGAYFTIGLAQSRLGHFADALATAKQCEAVNSTAALMIDCRMVEAEALDGLGRTAEEKQVLVSILDALPAKGSAKIRKAVTAELAAIDPEEAKAHGKSSRSRSKRSHEDSPDTKYFGTGFVVTADGQIVTNFHVVADCSTYWTSDGRKLSLLRGDKTRDLALLKGAASTGPIAALRGVGPKVGESIVVFGFPLAGILAASGTVTTGIVSADAGLGNTATRFQISAPIQPGNSGGPVLDAEGRVIGVVVSKLGDSIAKYTGQIPQNVNFAIPQAELLAFLKEAGVTPQFRGEGPKQEVSDIAQGARSFVTQIVCSPHA
jgi:S1-C subfamily serine protease